MSARNVLHARLYKGPNENRDDMLDAYRDEVRREAAAEIRAEAAEIIAINQHSSESYEIAAEWDWAADLIDLDEGES